jgi:hypothetical protein
MGVLLTQKASYGYPGKTGIFALLSLLLMVSFLAPALISSANAASTEMEHSPPDYFVPHYRIQLTAQVEDPEGISLVRCYFKAAGEADLVFVPMSATGSDQYSGVLPAPSAGTDQIEYLFLSVNNAKEVVRSQTFTITQDAEEDVPAWQEVSKQGDIKVSMELDKVPKELRGFSDSVTIDAVESGARFGVVALLYHNIRDSGSSGAGTAGSTSSSATVASASTATGATSAGMITAGAAATAGMSTAAIVGVGLGVAAVAGGTAVAVNAYKDNKDDNDNDSGEDLTEQTITGNWNVTGTSIYDWSTRGPVYFNENGSFTYDLTNTEPDGTISNSSGSGTWTLNGSNLTLNFDRGAVYTGTATGDSDAFVMVDNNIGWTLTFKR